MKKIEQALLKIFNQNSTIQYIQGDQNNFNSCINGLKKDTIPDCKILDSFVARNKNRHYLININDLIMEIRVCKADEASDYDEYCIVKYYEGCDKKFIRIKNSMS